MAQQKQEQTSRTKRRPIREHKDSDRRSIRRTGESIESNEDLEKPLKRDRKGREKTLMKAGQGERGDRKRK